MKVYKQVQSILMRFGGAAALATPLLARAQATNPPSGINVETVDDLVCIVWDVAAVAFWAFIALSVVFIIVAAYYYLFSGGDTEKVKKASRALTATAVAIIVAIIAWVIPTVLANYLGAGETILSC